MHLRFTFLSVVWLCYRHALLFKLQEYCIQYFSHNTVLKMCQNSTFKAQVSKPVSFHHPVSRIFKQKRIPCERPLRCESLTAHFLSTRICMSSRNVLGSMQVKDEVSVPLACLSPENCKKKKKRSLTDGLLGCFCNERRRKC